MINYLKKEGDSPEENELPLAFTLTQFHIVFIYPKNITILSNISNEIVYYQNFENQYLQGIQLDQQFNRLILFSNKEVLISFLKGEDEDAWKYYLKRSMIKEAL